MTWNAGFNLNNCFEWSHSNNYSVICVCDLRGSIGRLIFTAAIHPARKSTTCEPIHFCDTRCLATHTCCRDNKTSASCRPASMLRCVHTLHGLSMTLAMPISAAGHATAASKAGWNTRHTHLAFNTLKVCKAKGTIKSFIATGIVGGLQSAVGLSLWQARRSGTHYRLSFVVCLSVLGTLGAHLRRYCSRDISAFSGIEMRCIILRYINFLFYSILFQDGNDVKSKKNVDLYSASRCN